MKAINTQKYVAALVLVALLCITNATEAQIKVVGDDYSNNLTGAKSYYDQDVDFEKYFPAISSKKLRKITPRLSGESGIKFIYRNLNLTGDTIYLLKDIVIESGTDVFNPSFCIDHLGKVRSDTMFAGYYEVVGYIFCTENEDSVRASLGIAFDEHQYTKSRWSSGDEEVDDGNSDVRREKRANQKDDYSIQKLKEEILEGYEVNVDLFVRYIVFRSIDTASKKMFYLGKNGRSYEVGMNDDDIILLRFYNEALSFVGKEVIVTDDGHSRNDGWRMMSKYRKTFRDPLSNMLIKIEDDVFKVKDIVMKDNNFYAILEGEKTGSFALTLSFILNVQDRKEACWYYRNEAPDNNGDSQNLSSVPCLFCDKSDTYQYIVLIKKDDVRILDQRAEMVEAQREKAWKQHEIKEKQERAKKEYEHKQQMITKYGSQFGSLVAKQQVAIGMSKEMCRDAWGKPINTYRTTTKYGQSEVWCYNYKTRIYFYNGKVVQIDN